MRASSSLRSLLAGAVSASMLLASGSSAIAQTSGENKALRRPVTVSSVELAERNGSCRQSKNGCGASNATDGDTDTRWGSDWAEGQWAQVDLGGARAVDTVQVSWELSFPTRYRISTSQDGSTFSEAAEVRTSFAIGPDEYVQTTGFDRRLARYVRVTSIERRWPQWGMSMWEFRVFGPADPVTPPSVPAPQAPTGASGGSTTSGPSTSAGSAPFETTRSPSAGQPPAPASGSGGSPTTTPAPARRTLLAPFPTVRIKGTATSSGARIELLQVRNAQGANVRVVCRGSSCSRRLVRQVGSGRVRAVRGFFKAGTVIEVFVTKRGTLGKYTRFVIRRNAAPPRRTDSCATHGAARPTACPAAR